MRLQTKVRDRELRAVVPAEIADDARGQVAAENRHERDRPYSACPTAQRSVVDGFEVALGQFGFGLQRLAPVAAGFFLLAFGFQGVSQVE